MLYNRMAFASLCLLIQMFLISLARGTCTKDCFPTLKQGETIESVYNKFNITKEVLADVPETLASIRYVCKCVDPPGVSLLPTEVASPPDVAWKCDKELNYTLIMVDPDFPNPDPTKQFLHWWVDEIPNCNVKMGVTVKAYVPPTPPPATGPHKYTFLVFIAKGNAASSTIPVDLVVDRIPFSTAEFAKSRGKLWAGNFFLSESLVLATDLGLPV